MVHKKQYRPLLCGFLFYLFCVALFSFYLYTESANTKLREIDKMIYSVAVSIPIVIGEDGMKNVSEGKLSEEEYHAFVKKISRYSKAWGATYIYQMKLDNDGIYTVFTSANDEEIKHRTYQKYNEIYSEALRTMFEALRNNRIVYDSVDEPTGPFRAVYVPMLQQNGELHFIGVDYSLENINRTLRKEGISYFIYGIISLCFAFPLMYMAYSSLASILYELKNNFDTLSEITEQYKNLSCIDALTKLSNRRYFMESAEKKLQRPTRSNKNVYLGILDLDHFKQINDTYGHNSGDIVLKSFSKLLRESLRGEDLCGRWGGEEFAVMLFEHSSEAAKSVFERLRIACEKNTIYLPDERTLSITVSAGIALFFREECQHQTLEQCFMEGMNRADIALYTAKQTGRNRVCVFGEENEPGKNADGSSLSWQGMEFTL